MLAVLRIIAVSTVVLLAACGEKNGPATKTEEGLKELEGRGDLPVLDRSASIRGADHDNDGVRDDMARYIAALPDSEIQKRSLGEFAKRLNGALLADTANADTLESIGDELRKSVRCVWKAYPSKLAIRRVEEIRRYMVNTRERFSAYVSYTAARSGSVSSSPLQDECR